MPLYVDGYVLPVPRKNLKTYTRMSTLCGDVWREHGAMQYVECVAEDLNVKMGLPFPRLVKPKRGETIVFSWIVFKSRAHRDRVNAKVLKDPRLGPMMKSGAMPFDVKRMSYGGFEVLVEGKAQRGRRAAR